MDVGAQTQIISARWSIWLPSLAFLGVVVLFFPHVGMMLALLCFFATLIVVAKDAVRFGRWRHEYGASIGRLLRSRKKRT